MLVSRAAVTKGYEVSISPVQSTGSVVFDGNGVARWMCARSPLRGNGTKMFNPDHALRHNNKKNRRKKQQS